MDITLFERLVEKLPFELGKDQRNALEKIIPFVSGQTFHKEMVLTGFAGTGKTTVLKLVVDYLKENRIDYITCAPTHKAKLVLDKLTGSKSETLHSLLKLSPKLDIIDLDLNDLSFISSLDASILTDVIIIDEASMVNNELLTFIRDKFNNTRILFVGDEAQIQPVKEGFVSKVFSIDNKVTLREIFRQNEGNPILSTLTSLRKEPTRRFENAVSENGSLLVTKDLRSFVINAGTQIKKDIENKDEVGSKILVYTNARVAEYNAVVRKVIFSKNHENEYNEGEILTCYDNMDFGNIKVVNSFDYTVLSVTPTEIRIDRFNYPGFSLKLYDPSEERSFFINILSNKLDKFQFQTIAQIIETHRLRALDNNKRRDRGKFWAAYFKIVGSFCSPVDLYTEDNRIAKKATFKYGYAMSVHKSQGSSYNHVFIDMDNVLKCRDISELRQLQYVSMSRSKNDVHLYIK